MLGVLGDLVSDVVVWPAGPIAPGTDTAARVFRRRGGSAANVAAHAAALVRAERGPVRFLGRVGDDDAGRALTASLSGAGVDVRVQRAGTTGTVVVLVDPDGERTMLPDRGAAAELHDPPRAWSDGLSHLHLPAYSLVAEPIGTAARTVADRVRQAGGTVSVDVSSVGAVRAFGVARFAAELARLDPAYVLATREEADLLEMPRVPVVVVKDGPRPARVLVPGAAPEAVPVPAVDGVRDTTGAGDAFAAGFLADVLAGATPVDACRSGHRSAATVLASAGA